MPAQTVIKVRRDTAANWISADPTLASGEIGFETDTNLLKIGNGTSAWTVLPYASGSGGASVEISETAPAEPEEGDVWFNSTDGRAYIYYDSTWVDLNPGIAGPAGATGATGAPGPGILPSATAPEDTTLVWYNTENGNAYTYYDGFWTSISGLPSIPAGGTTGQILAKSTNTDYATEWVAPSALTLLAQQTFTAATSIIIDNVFTSTYNSYMIVLNATTSTAGEVALNYRAATINATTNYNEQFIQGNSGTITGFRTTGSSHSIGRLDTSGGLVTATINGVALAQRTYGVAKSIDSSFTTRETGVVHTTATAYDGFRITVGSSTGQIRVYGLGN